MNKSHLFAIALTIASLPGFVRADASTPDTAKVTLRDGATLAGPYIVDLADPAAPPVLLSPTNLSVTYPIPARSVLAVLTGLEASTTDFAITDLQYFDSFKSFLVNCIAVPATSAKPDCNNWTYAVDHAFPTVGMDVQALQQGGTADIFFGSEWQVTTDNATASTTDSVTVTAQKYDPTSGNYVSATGETVGAVQFDANFVPTEFATSTVDATGHATLSLPFAGDYKIGIASSGYFPNVSLTIASSTPAPAPVSGGEGGGGGSRAPFDVSGALSYLTSRQHADGSFDAHYLTDWAAMAYAATGGNQAVKTYLTTTAAPLTRVTDFERHAMALEALGVNPYSGSPVDAITPIVKAYDGRQIGDVNEDSDDIFGLIAIIHAGYASSDEVIAKPVAFIVSRQNANGSWDASVDMTAAAVQALSPLSQLPGVSDAITKAELYLRSVQQGNGGFGNSFATSWVLQAITALGESPTAWQKGQLPTDYLVSQQQSDGGVEPGSADVATRVWATSYAVPAALGKSWPNLLQSFSRPPTIVLTPTGGAAVTATSTLLIATSTVPLATSTSPVASTTPLVLTRVHALDTIALSTTTLFLVKPKGLRAAVALKSAATSSIKALLANQPAAAAAAPIGFWSHAWSSFTSFFAAIL